ncbi:hypothetical protein IF2G_07747 [Cordyceps javanica]|nr:hypothetical protein IF2G_07747 [Cordyceps javanica]
MQASLAFRPIHSLLPSIFATEISPFVDKRNLVSVWLSSLSSPTFITHTKIVSASLILRLGSDNLQAEVTEPCIQTSIHYPAVFCRMSSVLLRIQFALAPGLRVVAVIYQPRTQLTFSASSQHE